MIASRGFLRGVPIYRVLTRSGSGEFGGVIGWDGWRFRYENACENAGNVESWVCLLAVNINTGSVISKNHS